MTHDKVAREVATRISNDSYFYGEIDKYGKVVLVRHILEALTSAEKNGYEKGREEEHQHHEYLIRFAEKHGWNEAISAAVKVANDTACNQCLCGNHTIIAEKLKGLRK